MAKFDVYRERAGTGYVLDCQADTLSDLATRFVVPLLPLDMAPHPDGRLNPIFQIRGEQHVMVTQFAGAMPCRQIGPIVASLRDHDIAISNALDMLISGI